MRAIISASRRTDIPGFYMRWFERRVRQGGVDVRNPVVKDKTYHVSLRPEDVQHHRSMVEELSPVSRVASLARRTLPMVFQLQPCGLPGMGAWGPCIERAIEPSAGDNRTLVAPAYQLAVRSHRVLG